MTDRFYINRLKRMVAKYGEDLCNWCPMSSRFDIGNDFIMPYRDTDLSKEEECCVVCGEITDRYSDISDCRETYSCPCLSFKEHNLNPHKQALKIIKKWETENGEEL